jgi:hypothetical protein
MGAALSAAVLSALVSTGALRVRAADQWSDGGHGDLQDGARSLAVVLAAEESAQRTMPMVVP